VREQGNGYVIDVECRKCGEPMTLDCGADRPKSLVLSLARSVVCDKCSQSAEQRAAAERHEQEFAARLASSGLERAEVRPWAEFDARTPDGLDRGRVIEAAREWGRMADPGGLCLIGAVGSGKTALAKAAAVTRLQHSALRWVSLARLVADLANFEDRHARALAVRVLTGKGALVLDDFDKVNVTDWLASQLFAAIDGRIEAGAPLLVTTNLDPGELRAKFGDAIYSRIEGYCRMIELAGPDYRLVNRRAAA